MNLAFFQGGDLEKNPGLQYLKFEADLDFSRPWFSEIKVQIKRPPVYFSSENRYIQAFCTSLLKIVAFACEKISIQVKKKYVSKKFKGVNIVISSRFL